MALLALKSGAYSSQSLLVNAQRSVNLYSELNPENTQPNMPVAHYPRPGLLLLGSPPQSGRGRCLYTATNGDLFAVIDQTIYFVNRDWQFIFCGQIVNAGITPVSIA